MPVSPILFQQTRSTTLGSIASSLPPSLDDRRTRGLCALGAQLPASSVRGIGARRGDDTVTLMGWGLDLLVALPPQAAYHGRWCWMGSWRWCRRGKGRRRSEETRLPDLMARFAVAAEMELAVPSARLD